MLAVKKFFKELEPNPTLVISALVFLLAYKAKFKIVFQISKLELSIMSDITK
jgi:hypothetical protein